MVCLVSRDRAIMGKDMYMCQLCSNHGIFNQPKRGHKEQCKFKSCVCEICQLNTQRRRLDQMERNIKKGDATTKVDANDRSSSEGPTNSPGPSTSTLSRPKQSETCLAYPTPQYPVTDGNQRITPSNHHSSNSFKWLTAGGSTRPMYTPHTPRSSLVLPVLQSDQTGNHPSFGESTSFLNSLSLPLSHHSSLFFGHLNGNNRPIISRPTVTPVYQPDYGNFLGTNGAPTGAQKRKTKSTGDTPKGGSPHEVLVKTGDSSPEPELAGITGETSAASKKRKTGFMINDILG